MNRRDLLHRASQIAARVGFGALFACCAERRASADAARVLQALPIPLVYFKMQQVGDSVTATFVDEVPIGALVEQQLAYNRNAEMDSANLHKTVNAAFARSAAAHVKDDARARAERPLREGDRWPVLVNDTVIR